VIVFVIAVVVGVVALILVVAAAAAAVADVVLSVRLPSLRMQRQHFLQLETPEEHSKEPPADLAFDAFPEIEAAAAAAVAAAVAGTAWVEVVGVGPCAFAARAAAWVVGRAVAVAWAGAVAGAVAADTHLHTRKESCPLSETCCAEAAAAAVAAAAAFPWAGMAAAAANVAAAGELGRGQQSCSWAGTAVSLASPCLGRIPDQGSGGLVRTLVAGLPGTCLGVQLERPAAAALAPAAGGAADAAGDQASAWIAAAWTAADVAAAAQERFPKPSGRTVCS